MRTGTSSTTPGIVHFVLSAALDPSDEVSQLGPGIVMFVRSITDEEGQDTISTYPDSPPAI